LPAAKVRELTYLQFFISKMKVAKEIYEKLAWLLEIYVEQMKSTSLTTPTVGTI